MRISHNVSSAAFIVSIMSAFSAMAESGTGGFAVVASGISQALVATASGIFVAIEAVVFFNFFQAKLGRVASELRLFAEEFCELLADLPAEPEPQTPAAPQTADATADASTPARAAQEA